jgi:hypothetical protein
MQDRNPGPENISECIWPVLVVKDVVKDDLVVKEARELG